MEDGSTNLIYTFSRTGNTANAMTVKYSVGGNAVFQRDYSTSGAATFRSTAGTINFAANSDTATLIINPKADTSIEADETVKLSITANRAYRVGTPTAVVGTILNDEVAAAAVVDNTLAVESDVIPTPDPVAQTNNTIPNIVQGLILDLSQMALSTTKIAFAVEREATYNNAVGFYQTVDAQGSIQTAQGLLKPTDAGYVQAALQNAIVNSAESGLNLTAENHTSTNIIASLNKSFYMPILVANSTLAQAAQGQVYTAFAGANADKTEHIRSLGNNTFGFEDMFGGGDRDYNDLIIKASIS